MKFDLTKTQQQIISIIRSNGKQVFVVGGACRDYLLGFVPKDLDFVTDIDLDVLKQELITRDFLVTPDEVAWKHGIIRVFDRDTLELVDIARFRRDISCDGRHAEVELTDTIEEDLARRDFSINSLAGEINESGEVSKLIDNFKGREDLAMHKIYFVGNAYQRIEEDALRMVRACRFTTLGKDWELDNAAIDAIKKQSIKIWSISPERIRMEFIKALQSASPSNFIRALRTVGLLPLLCPVMDKCF
jgi:tRNA nucleotidyltransferase (CCA-adding enzyme)